MDGQILYLIMLEKRREISSYKLSHFNDVTVAGESGSAAKHLFFGRRDVDMSGILFSIWQNGTQSSALSVSIKPYVWRQYQDGLRQLQPYNADMDTATSALVPTLVVERNERVGLFTTLIKGYQSKKYPASSAR